MKRTQLFICTLLLVFVFGCKTQEDIRREQTVYNLNEEVQQTKKTTATGNSRLTEIEERLNNLNGQIEEVNHSKKKSTDENRQLNERITALEESNKKQVEYLKALTEKVNNQSGYIEEVIESLAKIAKSSPQPTQNSKKKKNEVIDEGVTISDDVPATFKNGYEKYQEKDYQTAKDIFLQVSNNKKNNKKNREGSTHFLGMIELKDKNYESAKVYFSKLVSESPTSSYAPAAMLQLGKTFNLLKSNEEATMTFELLISSYPDSKEASEAKKLIK
jgi:TolA-binding protein